MSSTGDTRSFRDMTGNSYRISQVSSVSRNDCGSTVNVSVNGEQFTVEVTPTEAMNIIEIEFTD